MFDVFAKVDVLGTLYIEEVFFFFEEPQLFCCLNSSGHHFLVLLTDLDDRQWFLLPISCAKLALLKSNRVSVYTAFKEPEDGIVLYSKDEGTECLHAIPIRPEAITDDQLPDSDVYLDYASDPLLPMMDDNILDFAVSEGRDIFDIEFNKGSHIREIRCSVLGAALSTVQNIVYSLPYAGDLGRTPIDIKEKNTMAAVGFKAASFGVRLKSNNSASLLGETSMSKTLMEFADLLKIKDDEEKLQEVLRKHSKKTMLHYNSLMDLLNRENMELKVDIATPSKQYISVHINKNEISNIINLLHKEIEKSKEEITIRGTIIGIHTEKRTFAFVSSDDDEIFGKIDQRLKDFTLPKEVEATMERYLTINEASGKEKYKYTLISLKYDEGDN